MPESTIKPTRRYAAFLSYRHSDNREEGRRWAEWLHQALETYEVPRDLVGRPNLRDLPVPASLYPVFRDEEELPADADLSQNIRRALENSDLLIVLCSPRACQSRFVADEIRYFKELGKSDRILALMIDGEPNADDPGKAALGVTPDMECFPEPLRFGVSTATANSGPSTPLPVIDWTQHTEPIAADARPHNRPGQGYTTAAAYRTALEKTPAHSAAETRRMEKDFAAQLDLARLKLVAGALGVPLGQLRERDAVYRAKKFRRLAAILGSLALVAFAAAGVAVWQRAEANQQKAQALVARQRAVDAKKAADQLISFMQYDLRDTLSAVGRLDMMATINDRIRRYHDEHPPEPGDQAARDAADHERSAALDQQGDILLARSRLDEALKIFQESLAIRDRLAAKNPDAVRAQRDLALILERVGRVQEAQGALPVARQTYERALAISRRLAAGDPGNSSLQRELAGVLADLDDVQKAQGDLPAALATCRENVSIGERIVTAEPGNVENLRTLRHRPPQNRRRAASPRHVA